MKKFLSLTILMCAIAMSVFGQKAKLAKANGMFAELNFTEASKLYLEVLDKSKAYPEATFNLAECYRRMGDWKESEYWFGQAIALPNAPAINYLHFAQALQMNGNCSAAKEYFVKYNELVPNDNRGIELARACETTVQNELLGKNTLYQIKHIANINSPYDDMGPAFFQDGIVFSSERDRGSAVKRIHAWTGRPFLEMFFTKATIENEQTKEFKYTDADKYHQEINTKFHDGPVSFTNADKEIYFTRNNIEGGKVHESSDDIIKLKIFGAKLDGKKFVDIKGVPFNSDEYSVAHPSLSPDGTKMFFSSDMPGGYGGMDLYVSYLEGGSWSQPVNLGPVINTEGNEVFPFTHADGTLYFASDGFAGLGGLDIFTTMENRGAWSSPSNLGFPINSEKDDFGLILSPDRTYGYFSSDRDGGVGLDDIYSFTKFASELEVLVFDKLTGKPIQGASVSFACRNEPILTDANGKIVVDIPLEKTCTLVASKEGYVDNTYTVSTKGQSVGSKVLAQIPLSIILDFTVSGKIMDFNTGLPLANSKVVIESDCGDEVQTVMSDADGYYEFVLRPECCYLIKAMKEKYLTNAGKVCTRGKTVSEDMEVHILLKEHKPEIIFALQHIYYDFDKHHIREDASTSLQELYEILTLNPDIIVEIGSHTDARASDKYNDRLSQRRAESVVKWLTQRGISKGRLQAQGYGESRLFNECGNGVKCSEEDHQRNRRTEFRVIGMLNGQDGMKSSAPANIKVDRCKNCPF